MNLSAAFTAVAIATVDSRRRNVLTFASFAANATAVAIATLAALTSLAAFPSASCARSLSMTPDSTIALPAVVSSLAPGDTLTLAGGMYLLDSPLLLKSSGSSSAPIRIQSEREARAFLGRGLLLEPASKGAAAWVAHDPGLSIFRLVQPCPAEAHGAYVLSESNPEDDLQLMPYADRNLFFSPERGAFAYIGPGVFFAGDTCFIRLQVDDETFLGADGRALTRAGKVRFPTFSPPDPNRSRIYIPFGTEPTLEIRGASHIELHEINFAPGGRRTLLLSENSSHITVEDCAFLQRTNGVIVTAGTRDLIFLRCHFRMGFPPWLYWGDVKGAAKASTFNPAADAGMNGFGIVGVMQNVEIADCVFTDVFDGVFIQSGSTDTRVDGCAFLRSRDDAINLSPHVDRIEVGHNTIWRCFEGISLIGENAEPEGDEGEVFVHHNLIDVSHPQRAEREGDFAVFEAEWSAGIPFGRHDCGEDCGRAKWRVFQNTVVTRDARQLFPVSHAEATFARNLVFDFGNPAIRTDALILDNVIWRAGADPDEVKLDLGNKNYDPGFDSELISTAEEPEDLRTIRDRYRPTREIGVPYAQLLPPDWIGRVKTDTPGALLPKKGTAK